MRDCKYSSRVVAWPFYFFLSLEVIIAPVGSLWVPSCARLVGKASLNARRFLSILIDLLMYVF